jgi:single-strand DNA-binding protein
LNGINKAILIGNLGGDPEFRVTPQGTSVANFSLATSETRGRDEGREERTEWHRIVLWEKLAEIARDHLSTGDRVYIEGRLQTREWTDKNGGKRWTTEIVGRELRMLGGKAQEAEAPSEEPPIAEPPTTLRDARSGAEAEDDDLPF